MEKIIDLKDLLKHAILDLYSAEEQIIKGLPKIMASVNDRQLKEVLNSHVQITKKQKERLDAVKGIFIDVSEQVNGNFFSNLFGGSDAVKCKGIEGLIREAQKLLKEEMTPEATDAAIVGAVQKIKHYEIAAYGTARAYSSELNMIEVTTQLCETIEEEYELDELLTALALRQINVDAEYAGVNKNYRFAFSKNFHGKFPRERVTSPLFKAWIF